jgi:hypothetical protein
LYVSHASLLESQGQLVKAYTTLRTALHHLGPTPLIPSSTGSEWAGASYILDSADHIRAIGLSQKLGHLALQLSAGSYPPPFPVDTDRPAEAVGWLDAAESYLSGALTAMLKLGLIQGGSTKASGVIAGKDIVLPEGGTEEDGGRVDKRGLGMTMEALSEVYARKKQYEVSAQLLLQAISILLPPGSKDAPPAKDRCQGQSTERSFGNELMYSCITHDLHLITHPSSTHTTSHQSLPLLVPPGATNSGKYPRRDRYFLRRGPIRPDLQSSKKCRPAKHGHAI